MSATGKCRRLPTEGGGFARASYFEHDLRANAFAFVARENRFTLFRIML
jgi:hypothetical protein